MARHRGKFVPFSQGERIGLKLLNLQANIDINVNGHVEAIQAISRHREDLLNFFFRRWGERTYMFYSSQSHIDIKVYGHVESSEVVNV